MKHLSKEALKVRLAHLGNTIKCGLHSGIPPCCIHFYVTKWLWTHPKDKDKHWMKVSKVTTKVGREIGYIACPACLKNSKKWVKKLKKCNCYHGEECEGEPIYAYISFQ